MCLQLGLGKSEQLTIITVLSVKKTLGLLMVLAAPAVKGLSRTWTVMLLLLPVADDEADDDEDDDDGRP